MEFELSFKPVNHSIDDYQYGQIGRNIMTYTSITYKGSGSLNNGQLTLNYTFEAFGEPFILNNPLSFSQQATGVGNIIETKLSWTPTTAEIKEDPSFLYSLFPDELFNNESIELKNIINKKNITMSHRLFRSLGIDQIQY